MKIYSKKPKIRILGPKDEVEPSNIIPLEQREYNSPYFIPEFDPSKIRSIDVDYILLKIYLHEMLEQNFTYLTHLLRNRGLISHVEKVIEILWEQEIPKQLIIQGGGLEPPIDFPTASSYNLMKTADKESKKQWLLQQGIPEDIVDWAFSLNEQYALWLAKERYKPIKIIKKIEKSLDKISAKVRTILSEITGGTTWNSLHYGKMDWQDINKVYDLVSSHSKGKKLHDYATSLLRDASLIDEHYPHSRNISKFIEVADWLHSKSPDVSKLTIAEAVKLSDEWHEQFKIIENATEYSTHNVVYEFEDKWTIVELSVEDLKSEGEKMGHCVGGDCDNNSAYESPIKAREIKIYSLRSPNNKPHVTMEVNIDLAQNKKDGMFHSIEAMDFVQIRGRTNDEPIEQYKEKIKEWIAHLKSHGTTLYNSDDEYSAYLDVSDFQELVAPYINRGRKDLSIFRENLVDDYGLPLTLDIDYGQKEIDYTNMLIEYAEILKSSTYFSVDRAIDLVEALIINAILHNDFDKLEIGFDDFRNVVHELQNEYMELNMEYWPQMPNELEYTFHESEFNNDDSIQRTISDLYGNQETITIFKEELEEMEELPGGGRLDRQRMEDMEQMHSIAEQELLNNYDPVRFLEETSELLKKYKTMVETEQQTQQIASKKSKLIKSADGFAMPVNPGNIPKGQELADYVKTLQMFLKDNPNMDSGLKKLIENLPTPRLVKTFSESESIVLFETVNYVWKQFLGKDILDNVTKIDKPDQLSGCYWLLQNGILLHGMNHFSIAKQNASLFAYLLNLNGMAFQEYLSSPPDQLIYYIIRNGGVRMHVDFDKNAFFQMTEKTYSDWGKVKTRKYDFNSKIVKIIDQTMPYKGWNSGVKIKVA